MANESDCFSEATMTFTVEWLDRGDRPTVDRHLTDSRPRSPRTILRALLALMRLRVPVVVDALAGQLIIYWSKSLVTELLRVPSPFWQLR